MPNAAKSGYLYLPNDSIVEPRTTYWRPYHLDFVFEKIKLNMQGLNPDDPSFREQYAGWSEHDQRFVTFGQMLSHQEEYKAASRKHKSTMRRPWNNLSYSVFDLLKSEETQPRAQELVVQRVLQNPQYTALNGYTYSSKQIANHIHQGTEIGRITQERELHRVKACEDLLKYGKARP